MRPLLLILTCLAASISAAPLRLQLQPQASQLQFSYQFIIAGEPQQLSFSIDNAVLNGHFRQFRALKSSLLQQYLWRDLRAHVAAYPNARLTRLSGTDSLRYRIQAPPELANKLETELQLLLQQQTQTYLHREYYYQLVLPLGEQVIVPDHQRLMQESLPQLLPVASALHQKLAHATSRQSLAYISQWLQQIPYQDLSDRQQSSGSSFSPPLRVLQENRGDCDSKTVLLAALIRMLLPDVRLAIIYLPQHAMLAVQLPLQNGDSSVQIDGKAYLLLDPTGPAQLQPGQIGAQYQIYTDNGQFAYRLL